MHLFNTEVEKLEGNSPFGDLQVFFCAGTEHLAKGICEALNVSQEPAPVKKFPDGEPKLKGLEQVRGNDIFVVGTTQMPEDNTLEIKVLVDAIIRGSARRVTIVIPYLSLQRQDEKRRGREPISAGIRIRELQITGAKRALFVEVHSEKVLVAFDPTRMIIDHLYGSLILIPHIRQRFQDHFEIATPDIGGSGRAQFYADKTSKDGGIIVFHKTRSDKGELKSKPMMISNEPVEDKTVIIVDDMIDTYGTMQEVVEVLKENGAGKVYAAATHGLFSGPAIERIIKSPIDGIITTNTIYHTPEFFSPIRNKLTMLSIELLLARAIMIIHQDKGSISDLYREV